MARTLAVALAAGLSGCLGLPKPVPTAERRVLLSPVAVAADSIPGTRGPGLGLGQIRLPAYLLDPWMAVRRGSNEIDYLPQAHWAERLDRGVQRVLAANLAALVPGTQVRLSSWRPGDVAAEVQVTLEQLDVATQGTAVLIAEWRIAAPGGERTLEAGRSRVTQQGPSPDSDPPGAAATLSEALGELSRDLARAIGAATRPAP